MKIETSMAKSPIGNSTRRSDDCDFNLREWTLKAKISRENTNSRRFSASYITSFREDAKSFRSNISISSTASSPGYITLRGNKTTSPNFSVLLLFLISHNSFFFLQMK